MFALKAFDYGGQQVRTTVMDGQPWFVAKDVCEILELGNVTRAVERLRESQKGLTTIQTPGLYFINKFRKEVSA